MIFCALLLGCAELGGDSGTEGEAVSSASDREEFEYTFPAQEVLDIWAEPYTYPFLECFPVEESWSFEPSAYSENEAGEKEFCVWQHAQGCVPSGHHYNDYGSCDVAMTTSARFYKFPGFKVETDQSVLEDEEWLKESEWVQSEIRACGCTCCHDSREGHSDGFATAFDVSAPGVWTDTFTDFGLLTSSGDIDTTLLGGTFDPEVNYGFDRTHQIFPTTDPARMQAFFRGEIERRGLSDEQIQEQIDLVPLRFAGLYMAYTEETQACGPGEGMDSDGTIHWSRKGVARYLYVMEEGSDNIGDPPGLDHPEGIIWRVNLPRDEEPWETGAVTYGKVPTAGIQIVPEAGDAPELELGKRYKLYVVPDYGPFRLVNCNFTYGDALAELDEEESAQ